MTLPLARRGLVRSPAMLEAIASLEQALAADGGVLIRGESGTGGEVFARAIHLAAHNLHNGPIGNLLQVAMKNAVPNHTPFVEFDCAVANAVERRLFGDESGKVPHATLDQVTEFSSLSKAIGGTLLLKNIGELPGRLQGRLARILRDGEVFVTTPDGARVRAVTLRPIALIEPLDDDRVVPDLRRRLSQTLITVPPLRDRREDLPNLVRFMLIDICAELGLPSKRASVQAAALISALPWPGNLRELEGVLRLLVLKVPVHLIRQVDVLANVKLDGAPKMVMYGGGSLKQARALFEREYVASVLAQHHGRMAEAAKALGIQRTNLYRKVRQLSVKRRQSGQPA